MGNSSIKKYRYTAKKAKTIRVTEKTDRQMADLTDQYHASQADVYREAIDFYHTASWAFGTTTFKGFAVALDRRLLRQGEQAKAVEGGDNGY